MKTKSICALEFKVKNVLLIAGIVLCTMLSIVSSVMLGNFVDIISASKSFTADVRTRLLIIFLLMISSALASLFLGQFLPLKLNLQKSIKNARDTIGSLLKINFSQYGKEDKGYYINLVTNSSFSAADMYVQKNIEMIGNIICIAFFMVIAASMNVVLAIIYIAYIVIYFAVAKKPNDIISNFQKGGISKQDRFLSQTKKIVEEKREINITRSEDYFEKKYEGISGAYLDFVTKFKLYSLISQNLPQIFSVILLIVTMLYSTQLFFDGSITLGSIITIFQLSQVLQGPLNRVLEIVSYVKINDVHAERLDEFFSRVDEKDEFERLFRPLDAIASFEGGAFFTLGKERRKLFEVADLHIEPHTLNIIKGGNGSGKSTLLNFMTGFSEADSYTGKAELSQKLRDAAYLSLPVLLTDGKLSDNMFGKPVDERAKEILQIDFEDKIIDDSVNNLSFGEQQKVNLLRVLSSDSDIILLDEPFTNLDKDTINNLTGYLKELKEKKTIVAIMHSDQLDRYADQFIEISNGRLTAYQR